MFWRHLAGVLAAQGVTGLVVWLAFVGANPAGWALAGPVGIAVALITAMWLHGVSAAERRTEQARADLRVAEARESVRVEAERARAQHIRASERRRADDLRDAERRVARAGRTNGLIIKLGLTAGALAGVGVALMAAQLATLGLVVMTLAGGAAVVWRLRARRRAEAPILEHEPVSSRVGLRRRGRAQTPMLDEAKSRG